MASSEAGPSTYFTYSAAGVVVTGSGYVTARDVNVHNYNSPSAVYEFPLPSLIDTFHGREDEMRELDEAFFTQQKNKVVICGLGGFGKSELAKQYAQRCLDNRKVQHVVWIESEDPNELKKSFKKLKVIYNECADKQLVMIFDNCVSQKSIADYEPRGNQNHRVLITSQYKQWKSDVKIMELESLSTTSAMKVFRSVLGDKYRAENEHLYASLAHSVSFIPLGLQVVASYVEQGEEDFNLTDYVNEIKKSEQNIINKQIRDSAVSSYDKTIYGAMITSIRKIKNKLDQEPQVRKLAHDVLCFSAYLRPDWIVAEHLLHLVNRKHYKRMDNEFNLAIKLLSSYSFLRDGNTEKSYLVQHRTTQAFVRYYISKSKLQSVYHNVCLDLQLKDENWYPLLIFSYADSNVKVVHDFYKDNYMHENIGTFLQKLIKHGCIQCIETIFKNSDEQTKNHIIQYGLLFSCVLTENVEILKILLSHVNINLKNDNQDTALHVLAKDRDLKGIKFLVTHGADLNVPNVVGDLPLFSFIRKNKSYEQYNWNDIFELFKADFSLTNSNNETLLHAAVTVQQPELIDFLIENGLQLTQTDNNDWTPLDSLYDHISVEFYYRIDSYLPILKTLLTLGAKSNIKHTNEQGDSCGYLLLKYALNCNNWDLLELLLNSGVDINSRSCDQQTILHRCAIEKNLNATQIVIKHNADCYIRDCHGDTPLFYFVKYQGRYVNDMDFLKNMLDLLQCHPGHVDVAGNTLLHVLVATRRGYVELVEMLVTVYKFNVNIQNSNGDTPLHALILSKDFLSYYDTYKDDRIQIIKMLNSFNVCLDLENNKEETPLDTLQRICTEEYSYIINDLSLYLTSAPDRKLDT